MKTLSLTLATARRMPFTTLARTTLSSQSSVETVAYCIVLLTVTANQELRRSSGIRSVCANLKLGQEAGPPISCSMGDAATAKTYGITDLKAHTTEKSCFLLLHGKVYDVTDFLDEHPGGEHLPAGHPSSQLAWSA